MPCSINDATSIAILRFRFIIEAYQDALASHDFAIYSAAAHNIRSVL